MQVNDQAGKQVTSTNPKDAIGRTKPDLSLIPPAAQVHEAMAMMDGANKYGPYNWRAKTVAARVYVAAAMRHILDWLDGEEFASDSGIHHLGHARASLGIILDAQAQGTMVDDRPIAGAASRLMEQLARNRRYGVVNPASNQGMIASAEDGTCVEMDFSKAEVVHSEDLKQELRGVPVSSKLFETLSRQRRVYIAGPMRGYPKFNFPVFDEARDLARSLDMMPISPADLDRQSGFHEDDLPETATTPGITREFVERDCRALLSLRSENGDAIALLPGWEKSTGAIAEFFVARWLGLKVLDARTMRPFSLRDITRTYFGVVAENIRKFLRGDK